MLDNKIHLKPFQLVIIWACLSFSFLLACMASATPIYNLMTGMPLLNRDELLFLVLSITVFIVFYFVWRKSTYRKGDVRKIIIREGFEIKPSRTYVPFSQFGVLSYLIALQSPVCIIGKLDSPFNIFSGSTVRYKDGTFVQRKRPVTLSDLESVSHIDFYILLSSTVKNISEIDLSNLSNTIPRTGNDQIDSVIKSHVATFDDFCAKLIITDDYLCVSVIGGSWLGSRFERRITQGLELVELLKIILLEKSKPNKCSDYEILWEEDSENLFLKRK